MAIDLTRIQAALNDEDYGRDYAASEILQGLRGDLVHGNSKKGFPPLGATVALNMVKARTPQTITDEESKQFHEVVWPIMVILGAKETAPQEDWLKICDELVKDGSPTQQAIALIDEAVRKAREEELAKAHDR